jgi:hypothetical protein
MSLFGIAHYLGKRRRSVNSSTTDEGRACDASALIEATQGFYV